MTDVLLENELTRELEDLRERVLFMGAVAEKMVSEGLRALRERDSSLGRRVIERDLQLDRLEVEIDERCLRLLARFKPVARDLRLVTTVLKLVTELERLGDLACNISHRALELNREPPLPLGIPLQRMTEIAPRMLRDALDAFSARDPARAREVIEDDQILDALYAQCFPHVMGLMLESSGNVERATRHLSVAKALERIGDQVSNLAGLVLFLVLGIDRRRHSPPPA